MRVELDVLDALVEGDLASASRLLRFALDPWFVEERPRRTLSYRREQLWATPTDHDWVTRLVVDEAIAIGLAGFHGAPDAEGMIEVGYQIAAPHLRCGYARAALEALLEIAARTRKIQTVRASLAPSNEASLALVAQYDFVQTGEQWDEEDGLELVLERRARLPSRLTTPEEARLGERE